MNNSIGSYRASIRNISDYSPFGVQLVGRTEGSNSYRFGFQGQESDDEVKGDGNSVNYQFRMHDPRLGRFFVTDKLANDFSWNSPYAFSENRVIDGIELEGLEFYYAADGTYLGRIDKSTEIRIVNDDAIKQKGGNEKYKEAIQQIQNGLNSGYEKSPEHLKYLNTSASHTITKTERLNLLINPVIDKGDYVGYGDVNPHDCMTACKAQIKKEGNTIGGYNEAIQMYKSGNIGNAVSQKTISSAYDEINESLAAGSPIIVGVDYTNTQTANKSTDNTTDHFVTIVGRGVDDKGMYFTFYENATSRPNTGTDVVTNRLYINSDASLKGTTTWGGNTQYKVTQVRPNKE